MLQQRDLFKDGFMTLQTLNILSDLGHLPEDFLFASLKSFEDIYQQHE